MKATDYIEKSLVRLLDIFPDITYFEYIYETSLTEHIHAIKVFPESVMANECLIHELISLVLRSIPIR